jgi:hypothetical protein
MFRFSLAVSTALLVVAPALASEAPASTTVDPTAAAERGTLGGFDKDDLEYQKVDEPIQRDIKGLKVRFGFDLEWHELNNIDFRRLDETTDQNILDSDDRSGFSFTGVNVDIDYEVDETLNMMIGASHRGLWGTDQLGTTNRFGGWIYFTSIFIDWHPRGKDGVHVRFGRQPFELGTLAGTRDYLWADINDMVRVDVPVKGFGSLTLIPVDVVGSTPGVDDVNFAGYIASSTSSPWNFRGRNRTLRSGGFVRYDRPESPIRAMGYGFFTAVGAGGARRNGRPGTGADISYAGELGNFADNDWITNFGVRAETTVGPIDAYGHVDGSYGIDRKEAVARDVDTSGAAWGAGAIFKANPNVAKGLRVQASYFESMGAAYAEDGMQYSHGYVGMKGRHIDGLIANRYLGLHPAAYLGWSGIEHDLHDPDRKGGTRVLQLKAAWLKAGPATFIANFLHLQDTSVTFLDFGRLDTIDPPYGYSRAEFAAQRRIGQALGQELDLETYIDLSEKLTFNLSGGIFLPGGYYKTEVARVAGTQLGHPDAPSAWVMTAGTHLRF